MQRGIRPNAALVSNHHYCSAILQRSQLELFDMDLPHAVIIVMHQVIIQQEIDIGHFAGCICTNTPRIFVPLRTASPLATDKINLHASAVQKAALVGLHPRLPYLPLPEHQTLLCLLNPVSECRISSAYSKMHNNIRVVSSMFHYSILSNSQNGRRLQKLSCAPASDFRYLRKNVFKEVVTARGSAC